jgi:hypothetical protein
MGQFLSSSGFKSFPFSHLRFPLHAEKIVHQERVGDVYLVAWKEARFAIFEILVCTANLQTVQGSESGSFDVSRAHVSIIVDCAGASHDDMLIGFLYQLARVGRQIAFDCYYVARRRSGFAAVFHLGKTPLVSDVHPFHPHALSELIIHKSRLIADGISPLDWAVGRNSHTFAPLLLAELRLCWPEGFKLAGVPYEVPGLYFAFSQAPGVVEKQ